jgi:hypothetical protein
MMIRQIIKYLLISLICMNISSAQEVVSGLRSNSLLTATGERKGKKSAVLLADPVILPFFDDFSGHSYYPDPEKWVDDYVFVNNTYSDKQITSGIATFDCLDNNGRMYEAASAFGFQSDQLTSQPVNLNFPASDNVWLSFFYQAGGLGDSPEPGDSLTLQFLAPDESKWYSVWKAAGTTDKKFKPAIINITDSRFLKTGFQFRFTNYASLSPNQNDLSMVGNCDHWNLDYVLLDKGRNAGDTIFSDVAFTLPVRSVLKNHEAMPWNQYREIELQEMGSSVPIHYRNNDTITRNVTRNFEIFDVYNNSVSYLFSAGATNIGPQTSVDYNANIVYSFNSPGNDSALFRITSILKTDEFDPKQNDTLIYYQTFKNYFAFDDGTAEAGYGINGLGSRNAMFAYRFRSFTEDTLRAISICFNDSYTDANKRAFDLMVWDDNNGLPGNVLYTVDEVIVEQGQNINGFYTYRLPDQVPVNGIFYVGWRQRTESFLNAGLDVNTPQGGKQFYWLNGGWQESQVDGTVMIHAIVGRAIIITNVDDVIYKDKKLLKIWPNPASEYITIDAGDLLLNGGADLTIMDLYGHELKKMALRERIDVSDLPSGIYIIITSLNGMPEGYGRVIKTK